MDSDTSASDMRVRMIDEIVDDEMLSPELAALAAACLAGDHCAAAAAEKALDQRLIQMGVDPALPSARLRCALTDAHDLSRAFGWRGIGETLSICVNATQKVTACISQSISRFVGRVEQHVQRAVTRRATDCHHLVYVAFPPARAAQGRAFAVSTAA